MGWNNIVHGSATCTLEVLNQCATLLNNSIPGIPANLQISKWQLRHRLTPDPGPNRYQEAGESIRRPVFQLHAWANDAQPDDDGVAQNPALIQIALVFHLSLRRSNPNVPTVVDPTSSAPQQRWWVITVGCAQAVQNPSLYQYVKPRCVRFYKTLRTNPQESLVLLENNARWPPPTNPPQYEVDNIYLQMTTDATGTIGTSPLPGAPINAWPPYSTLGIAQLNGVRISYTGP